MRKKEENIVVDVGGVVQLEGIGEERREDERVGAVNIRKKREGKWYLNF